MATVRAGDFEWDEAKARVNARKHGVTFEEAMTVFLDDLAVPFEEPEHRDHLLLVGESQIGRDWSRRARGSYRTHAER